MPSTGDVLADQLTEVRNAMTAIANADLELTNSADENFEAWEDMYSAVGRLESATEDLVEAALKHMRAAEQKVVEHG